MINRYIIETSKIKDLIAEYPFIINFFTENKIETKGFEEKTYIEYLDHFTEEEIEDWAIDKEKLIEGLEVYINQMLEFLGVKEENIVNSLTIIAGFNKSGEAENFEQIKINKSEIVSIVGPTGSGKSRLLADIEFTAQKDTPTGRSILINEEVPDKKWRFSSGNKLVAQLSQNMNFIMDLTVREFLELHAKSRLVENEEEVIGRIIEAANNLAGEKFNLDTHITSLSGGQSRALMIADTAILSRSPIVLIDEIENAGIDRKKALGLLVSEEKIVLMATHDPNLALIADKRIVIKNGGIHKVIETSPEEKEMLVELAKMDNIIQNMRNKLRLGENIDKSFFE
ncbi:ABC-type lipoprotein export system, ATPase component [Desulfonispora thiosulfatigenes DSM 11270]|uniref:ABC-type lipoprotein export system, ATPase component n=1 Tax=Desulfonispora thiosulfatigenes DSM 11270 TaxID=656914 RepID=A0A1W1UKB8_DESTI|nr:ATP-binding cassette domain-containing protein [Desulfonispora thiosulfatigenes]SMB81194.1 ABC-type lipoprotein export system, ATPase component [Desulfonispora thiosulfatigenes DSM 11270]